MLLTYWLEQWQWRGGANWDRAADTVDLGTLLYAMVAVAVERSVVFMLWALEQRKKWRAKRRAETWAEVRAQARAEDKPEIAAWLERAAQEKGIVLDEPPSR